MAEELGTRDVLEQVDTRLGTLEQDLRSLDVKVDARFDTTIRWVVGLVVASGLTMMTSMGYVPR